ncbi:MAG: hypothetical protein QXD62_03460 [Candidatus Woesearchaeota archaeon]
MRNKKAANSFDIIFVVSLIVAFSLVTLFFEAKKNTDIVMLQSMVNYFYNANNEISQRLVEFSLQKVNSLRDLSSITWETFFSNPSTNHYDSNLKAFIIKHPFFFDVSEFLKNKIKDEIGGEISEFMFNEREDYRGMVLVPYNTKFEWNADLKVFHYDIEGNLFSNSNSKSNPISKCYSLYKKILEHDITFNSESVSKEFLSAFITFLSSDLDCIAFCRTGFFNYYVDEINCDYNEIFNREGFLDREAILDSAIEKSLQSFKEIVAIVDSTHFDFEGKLMLLAYLLKYSPKKRLNERIMITTFSTIDETIVKDCLKDPFSTIANCMNILEKTKREINIFNTKFGVKSLKVLERSRIGSFEKEAAIILPFRIKPFPFKEINTLFSRLNFDEISRILNDSEKLKKYIQESISDSLWEIMLSYNDPIDPLVHSYAFTIIESLRGKSCNLSLENQIFIDPEVINKKFYVMYEVYDKSNKVKGIKFCNDSNCNNVIFYLDLSTYAKDVDVYVHVENIEELTNLCEIKPYVAIKLNALGLSVPSKKIELVGSQFQVRSYEYSFFIVSSTSNYFYFNPSACFELNINPQDDAIVLNFSKSKSIPLCQQFKEDLLNYGKFKCNDNEYSIINLARKITNYEYIIYADTVKCDENYISNGKTYTFTFFRPDDKASSFFKGYNFNKSYTHYDKFNSPDLSFCYYELKNSEISFEINDDNSKIKISYNIVDPVLLRATTNRGTNLVNNKLDPNVKDISKIVYSLSSKYSNVKIEFLTNPFEENNVVFDEEKGGYRISLKKDFEVKIPLEYLDLCSTKEDKRSCLLSKITENAIFLGLKDIVFVINKIYDEANNEYEVKCDLVKEEIIETKKEKVLGKISKVILIQNSKYEFDHISRIYEFVEKDVVIDANLKNFFLHHKFIFDLKDDKDLIEVLPNKINITIDIGEYGIYEIELERFEKSLVQKELKEGDFLIMVSWFNQELNITLFSLAYSYFLDLSFYRRASNLSQAINFLKNLKNISIKLIYIDELSKLYLEEEQKVIYSFDNTIFNVYDKLKKFVDYIKCFYTAIFSEQNPRYIYRFDSENFDKIDKGKLPVVKYDFAYVNHFQDYFNFSIRKFFRVGSKNLDSAFIFICLSERDGIFDYCLDPISLGTEKELITNKTRYFKYKDMEFSTIGYSYIDFYNQLNILPQILFKNFESSSRDSQILDDLISFSEVRKIDLKKEDSLKEYSFTYKNIISIIRKSKIEQILGGSSTSEITNILEDYQISLDRIDLFDFIFINYWIDVLGFNNRERRGIFIIFRGERTINYYIFKEGAYLIYDSSRGIDPFQEFFKANAFYCK